MHTYSIIQLLQHQLVQQLVHSQPTTYLKDNLDIKATERCSHGFEPQTKAITNKKSIQL